MKPSSYALIISLLSSISLVSAADEQDVSFLTALVNDFQSHRADYLRFLQTAKDVPSQLETFATQVITYTDDSYTTLLDNSNFDVTTLENFATGLPWYTRIEANAGGSGGSGGSSTNTASSTSSSSSSSSNGGSSSAAAAGGSAGGSSATATTQSSTSSVDSEYIATHSENAGAIIDSTGALAPIGAVIGALALALL